MTARALTAETLGTALLVMAVVGSGIMADRLTTDTALALLANALATGAALIVLITIFAPLSGAHFNPVVTLVFTLRRDIPLQRALAYIPAQIIGGLVGVLLTHAMFGLPLLQAATTIRTAPPQWLSETLATFGLILTILGTIRAPGGNVALMVAAYITAAYWFTASTSFANPAVSIARAFTDTFAGIRPSDLPGFILVQIAGGLLAAALGTWLFRNDKAR